VVLTMAVLLVVQAALVGLAVAHARAGVLPRATRWITRAALAGTVVVSIVAIYSAWWEITTFEYAWTLPGKPLGTYETPTALGVLLVGVDSLLFIVAAVLACLRPRLGAAVLAFGALWVALGALRMWMFDPTFPVANLLQAVVVVALPALVVAVLVWSLNEPLLRSHSRVARPTSAPHQTG
jgi:hypothetical protein